MSDLIYHRKKRKKSSRRRKRNAFQRATEYFKVTTIKRKIERLKVWLFQLEFNVMAAIILMLIMIAQIHLMM